MRRSARTLAGVAAAVLLFAVALVGAVLVSGNTDWGRGVIERLTLRLTGGYVRLTGLGGAFPCIPRCGGWNSRTPKESG